MPPPNLSQCNSPWQCKPGINNPPLLWHKIWWPLCHHSIHKCGSNPIQKHSNMAMQYISQHKFMHTLNLYIMCAFLAMSKHVNPHVRTRPLSQQYIHVSAVFKLGAYTDAHMYTWITIWEHVDVRVRTRLSSHNTVSIPSQSKDCVNIKWGISACNHELGKTINLKDIFLNMYHFQTDGLTHAILKLKLPVWARLKPHKLRKQKRNREHTPTPAKTQKGKHCMKPQ